MVLKLRVQQAQTSVHLVCSKGTQKNELLKDCIMKHLGCRLFLRLFVPMNDVQQLQITKHLLLSSPKRTVKAAREHAVKLWSVDVCLLRALGMRREVRVMQRLLGMKNKKLEASFIASFMYMDMLVCVTA